LPALQKIEINKKGAVRRARITLENLLVKAKIKDKEDSHYLFYHKSPNNVGTFFFKILLINSNLIVLTHKTNI
jgi:hypothetical protein